MDVQTAAILKNAKAGDEIQVAGGIVKAVHWPFMSGSDTCGDCPVGHDDCEASNMHEHCLAAEIVFRMKPASDAARGMK